MPAVRVTIAEGENQNATESDQPAQPADFLATKYAPFFLRTGIDAVFDSLWVVLMGTREREEAHIETTRRVAERDEQDIEPTHQVPRDTTRAVHIPPS
jgi:hypothetical protein